MKATRIAAVIGSLAIVFAAPAYADTDTDFAAELQGYGIYGARDYNAWLAKIACKRIEKNLDADAATSVRFITANLPTGTTQAQAWQFLGASINTYCPEQQHILADVAAQQG